MFDLLMLQQLLWIHYCPILLQRSHLVAISCEMCDVQTRAHLHAHLQGIMPLRHFSRYSCRALVKGQYRQTILSSFLTSDCRQYRAAVTVFANDEMTIVGIWKNDASYERECRMDEWMDAQTSK